jgi:hypothetical protein
MAILVRWRVCATMPSLVPPRPSHLTCGQSHNRLFPRAQFLVDPRGGTDKECAPLIFPTSNQ